METYVLQKRENLSDKNRPSAKCGETWTLCAESWISPMLIKRKK